MFFKKKKQNEQAEPPTLAAMGSSASSRQSVFAPNLNPVPAHIDFGFGQSGQSTTDQSSLNVTALQPNTELIESWDPPSYESQPTLAEASNYSANASTVQTLPSPAESAELLWAQPETETWHNDSMDAHTAATPVDYSTMPFPEPTQPYLTETFENYTPQPEITPTTPNELPSQDALYTMPSTVSQTTGTDAFSEPTPITLDFDATYNQSAQSVSESWQDTPLSSFEPQTMSAMQGIEQATPPSTDDMDMSFNQNDDLFWNSHSEATQPSMGEALNTTPAAFLDSVNQQLYPSDLFSSEQSDLMASEQAFEEASQFLFPETMSAPLDWSDEQPDDANFDSGTLLGLGALFEEPTLDLGPSFQTEANGFNDISAFEEEPVPFASFETPGHPVQFPTDNTPSMPTAATDSFLSTAHNLPPVPEWMPEPSTEDVSIAEGFSTEASTTPQALSSGLSEESFDPFLMTSVDPFTAAATVSEETSETSFEFDTTSFDSGFVSTEEASTVYASTSTTSTDALWDMTPPAFSPPEEESPSTHSAEALSPDYTPSDIWFSDEPVTETHIAAAAPTADSPIVPPISDISAHPDDDFYAVSFTLNELGELVPDYNHAEMAIQATEPEPSQISPPPAPAESLIPSLPPISESTGQAAVAASGMVTNPAPEQPQSRRIQPKPLMQRTPKAPEPQSDKLEEQWHSEPQTSAEPLAPTTTTLPQADELMVGNLEIISVCPLSAEKRLILIHNNGLYALMGQSGQEQPAISALKVFEHNPIAYQNTFTAVEEGQAGQQGMYVVQVGTWHGIISTFQDKITLHTELG